MAAPQTVPVAISTFSETIEKGGLVRTTTYIVFQDVIYYQKQFPYPTRKVAGQWWADVPPNLLKEKSLNDSRQDTESKPVYGGEQNNRFAAAKQPESPTM